MRFALSELPNDEVRLYCSLEMASLTLDDHCNAPLRYKTVSKGYGTVEQVPEERIPIAIKSDKRLDLRFIWTALMVLGPTRVKGFDQNHIKVLCSTRFFDPKNELSILPGRRFSSDSLYNQVFKAIAADVVKFNTNESEADFGHHVPDSKPALKAEVAHYMAKSVKDTYFVSADKTFSFHSAVDPKKLFALGARKVAHVMSLIPDEVETLDLRDKELNLIDGGYLGSVLQSAKKVKNMDLGKNNMCSNRSEEVSIHDLSFVVSHLAQTVNSLNLDYNCLSKLGAEGWAYIFSKWPSNIKSLSLIGNDLHLLGVDGLITFFSTMPAHITELNLRNNGFSNFTPEEMAVIRSVIPARLAKANLQDDLKQKAKVEVTAPRVQPRKTKSKAEKKAAEALGEKSGASASSASAGDNINSFFAASAPPKEQPPEYDLPSELSVNQGPGEVIASAPPIDQAPEDDNGAPPPYSPT